MVSTKSCTGGGKYLAKQHRFVISTVIMHHQEVDAFVTLQTCSAPILNPDAYSTTTLPVIFGWIEHEYE
jgi:hypothetical protein